MTPRETVPADSAEIGTMALFAGFLGAPIIWAVHLAVSYFLVTLDCSTDWDGARAGVVLATAVCAAAALGAGLLGWRGWKRVRGQVTPGELLDPMRIRGFLTLSGVLMAVLFTGAIVLAGMSPLLLPMCS